MGGLALLFPGQASQAVGMGVDLRARSARARSLFELADRVTGLPVAALCEAGPLERLTATDVAQPAVVATSLAALAVLREALGDGLAVAAVAGHSVGELAAYAAAGVLADEAALRLVHVRAQAMADACARVDGAMAAVLNLDEAPLRAACEQASDASGTVQLANLNAPGQLVISGERAAVERAGEAARAAGARRVLTLNVGGPFHSDYMRPAADALQSALPSVDLHDARLPVVVNVTAAPVVAAADLASELVVQVYSPVRWADSLVRLAELGADRFVEVGPGQVLAGLVKRTLPSARVVSFGALADLDAVAALARDADA
jgi:[acyl-carrier-protein] S-malonyltransferase